MDALKKFTFVLGEIVLGTIGCLLATSIALAPLSGGVVFGWLSGGIIIACHIFWSILMFRFLDKADANTPKDGKGLPGWAEKVRGKTALATKVFFFGSLISIAITAVAFLATMYFVFPISIRIGYIGFMISLALLFTAVDMSFIDEVLSEARDFYQSPTSNEELENTPVGLISSGLSIGFALVASMLIVLWKFYFFSAPWLYSTLSR